MIFKTFAFAVLFVFIGRSAAVAQDLHIHVVEKINDRPVLGATVTIFAGGNQVAGPVKTDPEGLVRLTLPSSVGSNPTITVRQGSRSASGRRLEMDKTDYVVSLPQPALALAPTVMSFEPQIVSSGSSYCRSCAPCYSSKCPATYRAPVVKSRCRLFRRR